MHFAALHEPPFAVEFHNGAIGWSHQIALTMSVARVDQGSVWYPKTTSSAEKGWLSVNVTPVRRLTVMLSLLVALSIQAPGTATVVPVGHAAEGSARSA